MTRLTWAMAAAVAWAAMAGLGGCGSDRGGDPVVVTKRNARTILDHALLHMKRGLQVPSEMKKVGSELGVSIRDGWGREMRLAEEVREGVGYWVVTSAGPDGQFGTADDVRVTHRDKDP